MDKLEDERITFSADLFSDNGNIAISEQVFTTEIEMFNQKVPVDPDYWRSQLEENLKYNLDDGFITQEEYDEGMKFDAPYAKIIK